MPLAGGPSDKFGNRYERWWTVSQLLRILHGQAESIRIEDPGIAKAEFVMMTGGHRELHQAKRSHPDGKWSLATLGRSDVQLLQAIFDALAGNDVRFVFVSGSDAPELRELAHRAQHSEAGVAEFERFIQTDAQKGNFERLRKHWKSASVATAFEMLQRIEVRTIDERGIEEQVESKVRALFLADPDDVYAELRRIAEDSIHQTITRDKLIALLAGRGLTLRRLTRIDAAPALVHEVTERYLGTVRRKLIRSSLIPRAATQTLLERLAATASGGEFALTGKAGSGKTGCAIELVDALRSRVVPVVVLAFRLDRLGPALTTAALGQQLGMEESPALVLAAAAAGREAVLVVDQVDAVSTVSGRNASFLEAVEGLLTEARGLRDRLKLHVVVVCRSFDWENDHRLRRLLQKEHLRVDVTEFSIEEVKTVVSGGGFRPELFQSRQLELLRLAQNLALFLEAGFVPTAVPAFNTAKELFDRYWDEKRREVTRRAAPLEDHWTEVIRILCDEMTRIQQLNVAREKLDCIPADFVAQMASEGVLTFDGRVYGFGHESFFDYCFARESVAKDQSLTEFIVGSEQHLFRRAQVRQVLAYLRDANRERYCHELTSLLSDSRVRFHLKDLAVSLTMNLRDPGDDEWAIMTPWLDSQSAAFVGGSTCADKFASLVWQHFSLSTSWFRLADQHGVVASWLASDNEALINVAVQYLSFHQRHAGDRVAELLVPFVGKGAEWPMRLRRLVEWADHEKSRRFFDLFLRLIDDGTLDDARGPIATNATFWSMFHGMANTRPEWVAEVLAHWLRRRLSMVTGNRQQGAEPEWRKLFNHDDFGVEYFHRSAAKAPQAFAENILPVILEIIEVAAYGDGRPPRRDSVWPFLFKAQYQSADVACLNALVAALETLARTKPPSVAAIVAELKTRNTYIANYLLLTLYAAAAAQFADTAALLLCEQPWRFQCGFSDNSYWVSIHLIRAIVPHSSSDSRAMLEAAIMKYSTDYERNRTGFKRAGEASFELLSAIEPQYRSRSAQTRFEQLERKFGLPNAPPRGIRVYSVSSPIQPQAAEKMTDEQWLKAIAKYASEARLDLLEHPERGGAWELAGMLRDFVGREPERFARLSLTFPTGTNPAYTERTLDALKGSTAGVELKLAVCRKAYSESRLQCGKAITDLLGSIETLLPDDAVQMLDWLATKHPDPETELWDEKATSGKPYYGGEILTHGINTTRGRAAEAIRDLILRDASYVARFSGTLQRLVSDEIISVRSCAASTLLAVAQHDVSLAMELFENLADADDRLLATEYTDRFLYHGLQRDFARFRPNLERMLGSPYTGVSDAGARLASVAALSNEDAHDLVERAMSGGPAQRLGVARVAAQNIGSADCRNWCENHLLSLFNDCDREVCQESASCFRNLTSQRLQNYEKLITAFCDSSAYQSSSHLLYALEESRGLLPGITCRVCEKFLERFSDEAKDIRTGRAADVHIVVKLIFRTYHQHQRDTWSGRCLDLIDRMCLEGFHDVRDGFEEFER